MSDLSKRINALSPEQRAVLAARLQAARPAARIHEPIAVIGMSCRFPGGADTPERFWDLLVVGADAVTEVPAERWALQGLFDPDPATPGRIATKWGGFLNDVDRFDAAFFGISPREAQQMDPQQRILLEVAWEALDDAGQDVERLAGTPTGVFVGLHSYSSDYLWLQLNQPDRFDSFTGTGSAHNIVAGRLSYLWDLRGPAVVVDTACSSSLVAVHMACQSLQTGESDMAIAGGVNLILTPLASIALSRMRMFSSDGRCKSFDAGGDGFVRSEGCGVVVLKRLSDAIKAGDNVLAVIRGSAINQDGRTNGITAPSSHSQQAVIRQALENAGAAPDDIGYVEAHGTGTPIGDPIEIEALADVFGGRHASGTPCVLGSAKANIGHLEGAAGIAGLIKAVLALRHAIYPPLALFQKLNPHISFDGTPFEIPTVARPWLQSAGPRLAGVSSFGWSGTNAHVILEEGPTPPATADAEPDSRAHHLLTLSARSEEALRHLAASCSSALTSGVLSQASLSDVCYSAAARRTRHDYRAAVCGTSRVEIAEGLDTIAQGERRWDISVRRAVGGRRPHLAFVLCGQGAQSPGMGTELLEAGGPFSETVSRIAARVRELASWSLIDELRAPAGVSRLDQTEFAQPALFAVQVGLAAEWASRGVVPSVIVGHSVGEIAAAHVAGVLSLDDAVRVVVHRAKLMQRATGYGRMVSVLLSAQETEEIAAASKGKLSLAAENGPRSCVLSGDTAAIQEVSRSLEARGVGVRLLPVNYAFHSRQMEPILRELRDGLSGITPKAAQIPVMSTVSGKLAQAGDFGPDYWVQNVRQPVRFASALIAACRPARNVFVEIGPQPVLTAAINESAAEAGEEAIVIPSLQRGRPDALSIVAGLGALHTAGCSLDVHRVHPDGGRLVPLPRYPWQQQRYWLAGSSGPATWTEPRAQRVSGSLLGSPLRSPLFDAVVFETTLGAGSPAYLSDHHVEGQPVCPASAYIALALAAGRKVIGSDAFELRDILVQQQMILPDRAVARLVHTIVHREADRHRFEICSLPSDDSTTWVTHATGSLVQVPDEAPATAPCAVPADADAMDPLVHYDSFDARGLSFGPAFRCIDSMARHGSEATAELTLPEDVAPNPELQIHPVLLDGAFHVVWMAMPTELVEHIAYLPFSIERVRCFGAAGATIRANGRRRMRIPAGGETLTGDLTVVDTDGRVLIEFSGFTMKRMGSDRSSQRRRRIVGSWFYEPRWTAASGGEIPTDSTVAGDWLIVGDGETARRLAAKLDAGGGGGTRVTAGASCASEVGASVRKLKADGRLRGIVVAPDAPDGGAAVTGEALVAMQASVCATVTSVVQAVVAAGNPPLPSLWLVTQGADAIVEGPSAATPQLTGAHTPISGLARALRMELPELRCVTIDLDPSTGAVEQAALLVDELRRSDVETDVAFRAGRRFVRRLVRVELGAGDAGRTGPSGPVRLSIPVRGVLDNLVLSPARREPPAAGEIEIEVKAAGLNFRDVLNALGMYPGDAGPLGNECAGTVVAVGEGVSGFAPGDDVIAVGSGTLGSYVTTPALLAARKPQRLSYAEAATIPIVFLTVYEALFTIAELKAGNRILIHAAAGGVGLAAVQMAMKAGAEVFATAGSPHKRDFLKSLGVKHVMDSRALDFAREIIDATGGAGVDVVLNSLSGDFIERSLAVMARNGRFVELGKIGIWSDEQVAAFRDDIAYDVLYLGDLFHSDPARIMQNLESLTARFESGELQPLPITAYALTEAADAFRYMAQAHHIGKVVLTPAQPAGSTVRSDATYLVTGGLGALGLSVADWMVSRGARYIVLAGRNAATPAQQQQIDRLCRSGARVTAMRCDIASFEESARLLHAIESSGPAIRGIIHSAGVIDDGVALQQTKERFLTVLRPKAGGAWNLHLLTKDRPLDFFVLFSSVASLLGSPGQSNYAAANGFLDALARQRRAEGLPATSISWGPWGGESGMAAAVGDRNRQRWLDQGITAISKEDGILALELAIASGLPHAGVLTVDWERYLSQPFASALRPLAAHLLEARPAAASSSAARPAALSERLRRVPFAQRRAILLQHVRDRALKVLGLPAAFALDAHQGLRDVGLDSLLAIELRNVLQADAQASLPATLAFDYPTLEALATHLAAGPFAEMFAPAAGTDTAASPEMPTADDLAQLSDAEAEALLLAELSGAPEGRSN